MITEKLYNFKVFMCMSVNETGTKDNKVADYLRIRYQNCKINYLLSYLDSQTLKTFKMRYFNIYLGRILIIF